MCTHTYILKRSRAVAAGAQFRAIIVLLRSLHWLESVDVHFTTNGEEVWVMTKFKSYLDRISFLNTVNGRAVIKTFDDLGAVCHEGIPS